MPSSGEPPGGKDDAVGPSQNLQISTTCDNPCDTVDVPETGSQENWKSGDVWDLFKVLILEDMCVHQEPYLADKDKSKWEFNSSAMRIVCGCDRAFAEAFHGRLVTYHIRGILHERGTQPLFRLNAIDTDAALSFWRSRISEFYTLVWGNDAVSLENQNALLVSLFPNATRGH